MFTPPLKPKTAVTQGLEMIRSECNWKLKYNFPEADVWLPVYKSPTARSIIGLPAFNYHHSRIGILCPQIIFYDNDPIGIVDEPANPRIETFSYLYKLYHCKYWDRIMASKKAKNISIFDVRDVFLHFGLIVK